MDQLPRRRYGAENRFIARATAELAEAGYRIAFTSPERMQLARGVYEYEPGGYFEYSAKRLTVCPGYGWFRAFVHEFAHFKQACEGRWIAPSETNKWWVFDEYLARTGPLPRKDHLLSACRLIQACELDAERRVLAMARQYDLCSIDLVRYTKGANAYVLQYEAARRTRAWPVRWLLASPRLLALMSGDRLIRQPGRLPQGYLGLYLDFCRRVGDPIVQAAA